MKLEISTSHIIDLYTFIDVVGRVCPRYSPARQEELALRGIDNSETGLLDYCLIYGPRRLLTSMVETRRDLRDICIDLDIHYENEDSNENLGERIVAHIVNFHYPYNIRGESFATILRFVENNKTGGSDSQKSLALDCANMLETVITEVYSLFIGAILYEYLDTKEQRHVKNILKSSSVKFGTRVSQLIRIEMGIRRGDYSNAAEELQRIHGQSSIFGSQDMSILQKVSSIRGQYLAHNRHPDKNLVDRYSKEVFKLVGEFCAGCIEFMPRVIFPVHFGIDEWGFKYISYIDESDLDSEGAIRNDCHKIERGKIYPDRCQRFFLIEKPVIFHAFEKAYCLHPSTSQVLRDPMIIYLSDLSNIGSRLP